MNNDALPVTASFVFVVVIVWFLLAFPIGVLTAMYQRTQTDKSLMVLVLIGASAHPIWRGLILSYLLGYKLNLFPISGYCDLFNPSTSLVGPTHWAYDMPR